MRRFLPLSAALFLLAAVPSATPAETRISRDAKDVKVPGKGRIRLDMPVHMNADTLNYDEDTGVAIAEGNVELVLGNRTMRADRVLYDSRTGDAELAGKVRYKDGDEEFSFDRVTLNFDTETGILYNGTIRIRTNNYQIASERIEKTGKQSFSIEKGSLTTCPCDPEPDWKFNIRRAQVILDDYAYGRDVTFRIRDVPVAWLPWGAFPVKLTRQSGFLIPSFSSNHYRGFTLSVPYYWAINRWSDATVTLNAMTQAGFRPEGEYRFALNPDSLGVIQGTYFRDREMDKDRWRVSGGNTYRSGDWTANARWDIPSDNQYYVDIQDNASLRSASQAQATGFVGISGEGGSQEISATWYKEMESPPPAQDNTVQRLPEYTATVLPLRIPVLGIDAGGELLATNFYRQNSDKELRANAMAAFSRTFVLYPSVSLTPYVFLNVLGDRYEQSPGSRENAGRVVPGGGVTVATEARRDFPGGGQGFVHVLGTSLGYRYVPRVAQDNIPVTDRWSRLSPQNRFLLNITQRFLGLKEGASPKEMVSLNIEWAYDVGGRVPSGSPYVDPLLPFVWTLQDQIDTASNQPQSTRAVSDIYAKFVATPFPHWNIQGSALVDPSGFDFATGALGGEWKIDDDHRVSIGYRYTQKLAEDLSGTFVWRPWQVLRLQAHANYSVNGGGFTEGGVTFRIYPRSDCWNIGLSLERQTQPTSTSWNFVFGLKGIGSTGN